MYIIPLSYRIHEALNPGEHNFGLALVSAITLPLQGLLNALAFGLDKTIMNKCTPSQIMIAARGQIAGRATIQEYSTSKEIKRDEATSHIDPMICGQSPQEKLDLTGVQGKLLSQNVIQVVSCESNTAPNITAL